MKYAILALTFLFSSFGHAQDAANTETTEGFQPGTGVIIGEIEECDFVEILDNNQVETRDGYCINNVQFTSKNMKLAGLIMNHKLVGKKALLIYDGLHLHQSHFDWTNSAAVIKALLMVEDNNFVNLLENE